MNAPSESLDSDHSGKDSSNSDPTAFDADDLYDAMLADETLPNLPSPINWYLLNAEEAEAEWLELNQWVDQLRRTYSLPISVIPPFWHRHPELLWELSALHLHWLCSYDPEQAGTGPLAWHKEFAASRARLREWVSICGTRLDTDRPSRHTSWPGEPPQEPIEDEVIPDRTADFIDFVAADAAARQAIEDAFLAATLKR